MKESTPRFPDVVNMITELCRPEVSSFILDAEVSLNHMGVVIFFFS
jgi:DNA ligase 1